MASTGAYLASSTNRSESALPVGMTWRLISDGLRCIRQVVVNIVWVQGAAGSTGLSCFRSFAVRGNRCDVWQVFALPPDAAACCCWGWASRVGGPGPSALLIGRSWAGTMMICPSGGGLGFGEWLRSEAGSRRRVRAVGDRMRVQTPGSTGLGFFGPSLVFSDHLASADLMF